MAATTFYKRVYHSDLTSSSYAIPFIQGIIYGWQTGDLVRVSASSGVISPGDWATTGAYWSVNSPREVSFGPAGSGYFLIGLEPGGYFDYYFYDANGAGGVTSELLWYDPSGSAGSSSTKTSTSPLAMTHLAYRLMYAGFGGDLTPVDPGGGSNSITLDADGETAGIVGMGMIPTGGTTLTYPDAEVATSFSVTFTVSDTTSPAGTINTYMGMSLYLHAMPLQSVSYSGVSGPTNITADSVSPEDPYLFGFSSRDNHGGTITVTFDLTSPFPVSGSFFMPHSSFVHYGSGSSTFTINSTSRTSQAIDVLTEETTTLDIEDPPPSSMILGYQL